MQFIKVGDHYINMAQVLHIEHTQTSLPALNLYMTGDEVMCIAEPGEIRAVLAWLGRNSVNVMKFV